ncbi:amine oxidase [Aspergillus ellipticus CBS 707.79]|uniref:Amine oxidase n=1 Tax=Aspergillus ellipticus CBS 707.79 TaxID=1448320 RepID=A0A319EYQ8_9EURO|nr:amine oxidase [Aspergillus ellipticus CBS 707.79]
MSHSKEGYLWTPTQVTEGLRTDAVQPSSTTLRARYEVIVIGAGFAGLIAARDLSQKHGRDVLLLEARDRIGGRTWTATVLGEEVEMGGTWVHWNQPHLYAELHRYGLHKHLKTSAGSCSPVDQSFKPSHGELDKVDLETYGSTLEGVAQKFFAIDGQDSRALMPYPHDPLRKPAPWKRYDRLTVQDRLDGLNDISAWEKELFASNISTFGSAPVKDIGVFELAGLYKLGRGGMTSFAQGILGEFTGDACFNTAVSQINHILDGVEILTKDGRKFAAGAVISTIPLNCLADIQFNQPLSPLRQAAIAKGHFNKGAKIHFKLRETLPGWFFTANDGSDSKFAFAFSDHNGTQPSGPSGTWCIGFGYNGHLTEKKESESIIAAFKKDINPSVTIEAYATHDWMNDPYSKGVWACWGPNSASAHLEELQKPHGRVIFASADWADGWRGFVDGAIERGKVAVRDTLQVLRTELAGTRARL